MEERLLYYAIKYQGSYDEIKQALKTNELINQNDFQRTLNSFKAKYLTILSVDYPKSLKYLQKPPYVLFYYGNIELLKETCFSVVGMRTPSAYGEKVTKSLVTGLVDKNYTIISGLALGIDAIAHTTSILNNGKTIAVLGSGIDYCYPKQNQKLYNEIKQNQLILSEYPNNLPPKPYYFPLRNRIVAALSIGLLVSEAKEKSGTMITVGYALDLGKPVFCVPSNIYGNTGCLALIRDGAILIRNVTDIINDLTY